MSDRRSARRTARLGPQQSDPPAEILMGPCIEDWAGEPDPPLSGGFERPFSGPWWRARRNWQKAVDEWAAGAGQEAWQVRNGARWRHPWSRRFVLSVGGAELVDYLEGRLNEWPGYPPGITGPHDLASGAFSGHEC